MFFGNSSPSYAATSSAGLADYLQQFSNPTMATVPQAMIGQMPGTGTWNMVDGNVGSALQQGPAGLGFNLDTGKLALSGLQTLSNLWGAFQSNKMAKDQLKFAKETTNTNLNNQIQTYNTSLADRINSRAKVNGQNQQSVDEYLALNRLAR